ncbi:DUF6702 family protein [Candidatus Phycosocius spiralis]|uniref:Uncharacterized protein n=1 Tax=Candidatus Phycosocius spiralis TaxID=2815099 RepID=A0ABQ4PSN3_9PROT|nr:DUF6702 family protein [Candidatus Phycosocius spiralis]GIU65978.1 hypothetical protein PsB1_0132 [Candidatus Phycosocius spiralis]
MKGLKFGLMSAALLGLTMPAQAHRIQAALSVVEISPTTQNLEITHRLYVHDLEHALDLGSIGMSWFLTQEGQAAIKGYCLRQFFIGDVNGRPLAIQFVGAELSGDLLYVYFEAGQYRGQSLTLDSNLLQDFTKGQLNQINLRRDGKTVSALFQSDTAAKKMLLP